jgi:CheY-like chemotaxis protein
LLLVSPDSRLREGISSFFRASRPATEIDATALVVEALNRMSSSRYDGVITTAESEDELASLVRVKKARPGLPVAVIVRDDRLRPLAEYLGANAVLEWHPDVERTSETVLRAIETGTLTRKSKAYIFETKQLVREIRDLTRTSRELIATGIGLAAKADPREFSTLLIEDDPNFMVVLVRALARAGIPPFVQAAGTTQEALEYLEGGGRFADRARFPSPSIIISDLNLPGESGLDLLKRVRSHPETADIGFIMYTSSKKPEDLYRAFELGANFYVDKAGGTDALIEVVKTVYARSKSTDNC